ncbi:cytochrome c biogenesis protein CcsA [Candidatus Poribacteria bacterium]|nr:cytochrome c biogenesis protein CcsA [Candidatus Poribacteria bacterium]
MTVLAVAAYLVSVIGYGLGTGAHLLHLMREDEQPRAWGMAGRNAGLLAHLVFLTVLGVRYGELPLVGIPNVMSFLALMLVAVFAIQEMRHRVAGIGVFVLGMGTLLQLLSWPSIGAIAIQKDFLKSPLFGFHVFLAIAGYAGFTLSAVYGVLYLTMYRALKSMRFGVFFKNLPPLESMSRMNLDAALIGLIAMTVSIVVGVLLSIQFEINMRGDAKFIQTLVGWALYSAMIGGHYALRWQGRVFVYMSLLIFAVFIGGMVVVMTVFKTAHQFT